MISDAYSWLRSISISAPASRLAAHLARRARRFSSLRREVLVDRDPEALDRLVAVHEPRQILGGVLARLGGEVAQPPVELDADAPAQLGIGLDAAVEARVEVLPAALEPQDEGLVVDARAEERHLLERDVHELRQLGGRVLDGVAQPDDPLQRRAGVGRPAQHRHRVRVVQEPRVRAELGHVVGDPDA